MFNYRQRRLWLSSCKRALRWEFWPMWLFYIPVVFYIIYLTLRYRRLSFTAVNPGMLGSGFVGESKSECLLPLQQTLPEKVASTWVIDYQQAPTLQRQQCLEIMSRHGLTFPIILKPDMGQRGAGVAIIGSVDEMQDYLSHVSCDTLLQAYIAGVEFGVFYYRYPDETRGQVYSLTHKCFPVVTGDGVKTLEELILSHPRLHYMARFLLSQHKEALQRIPAVDENVPVVRLGSHCRGSLFLDGGDYLTPVISETIDRISLQIPGFYFGRYDVRAASIEDFQKGKFYVIEVNGVTSESTNMYDPKYTLVDAYRILFKQWSLAFVIGQRNYEQGHKTLTLFELLALIRPSARDQVLHEVQ